MANVSLSAPRLATYATLAAEGQLPNSEQLAAAPGELTLSGASFGLADTAVTPGTYTAANITIDAKGRITAAANGITGLDGLYVRRDGSTPLTAPWNAGAHAVTLGSTLSVVGDGSFGRVRAGGAAFTDVASELRNGVFGDPSGTGATQGIGIVTDTTGIARVGLGRPGASAQGGVELNLSTGTLGLRHNSAVRVELTSTALQAESDSGRGLGTSTRRWSALWLNGNINSSGNRMGTIFGTIADFSGVGSDVHRFGGSGNPSVYLQKAASGFGSLHFIEGATPGGNAKRLIHWSDGSLRAQYFTGGTYQDAWRVTDSGSFAVTNQLTANGLTYPSNASGSVGDLVRKSADGVLSFSSLASLGLPATGTVTNSTLRWSGSQWVENTGVLSSSGNLTLNTAGAVLRVGTGGGNNPQIVLNSGPSNFSDIGFENDSVQRATIRHTSSNVLQFIQRAAAGAVAFTTSYSNSSGDWTFPSAGTFGARLSTVAGSAASPSFGFGTDSTTGLYRPGANQIGFATAGSARWIIRSTGVLDAIGSPDIGTSSTRVATVFGATADFSGNGTFGGTNSRVEVGNGAGAVGYRLYKGDAADGAFADIRSGGTADANRRWTLRVNGTTQHLVFHRRSAAGASVDDPLQLFWDTGNVQVANSLGVLGGIGCALGGAFGEEVTAGHHMQATQHVVAGTYVQAAAGGAPNGFRFSNGAGIVSLSATSVTFLDDGVLTVEADDAFAAGFSTIFGSKLYPGANNTFSNGLSTRRWSNVFSVAGSFSGSVEILGNITVRGDIDTDDPSANNIGRDSSRFASVHADYIMGGALGGDYDGNKGGGLMGAELTGVINGTETVTLPPASTRAVYLIINRHETNNGTIARTGSDTINGAAANFSATRMTLCIAISDGGTNWIVTIIGNFSADPT